MFIMIIISIFIILITYWRRLRNRIWYCFLLASASSFCFEKCFLLFCFSKKIQISFLHHSFNEKKKSLCFCKKLALFNNLLHGWRFFGMIINFKNLTEMFHIRCIFQIFWKHLTKHKLIPDVILLFFGQANLSILSLKFDAGLFAFKLRIPVSVFFKFRFM